MPTREPTFARRYPWQVLAGLALVVAVAVTTVLGGWAPATSDGPASTAPGTEVTVTPFRVRLDSAVATYEAGGRDAEPGQAFLVVEGAISLDVSESVGFSTVVEALVADLPRAYDTYGNVTADPEAAVTVAGDDSSLQGLGPGLTYDVQLTFTVDETDVPADLTVVLHEHLWRKSSLDGTPGWFDEVPAAVVDLEVAPLPASRPEPEEF